MSESTERVFSPDELGQLVNRDNLHLLIHGKVYDVSKFLDEHPGGDEILLGEAGQDASEPFEDVGHSKEAIRMLEKMYVGIGPESLNTSKDGSVRETEYHEKQQENAYNFVYLYPLALIGAYAAYKLYTKYLA